MIKKLTMSMDVDNIKDINDSKELQNLVVHV